jgi:hypothetical protein
MDKPGSGGMVCRCPYCEVEIEPESPICIVCRMVIIECVHCGEPTRDDAEACPHCGEPPK